MKYTAINVPSLERIAKALEKQIELQEKAIKQNELIIKKENEIIIIRKENVQRLVHEQEYSYEGFVISIYTQPENHFVVMTNGDKFNLTKKQYQIIKKWY